MREVALEGVDYPGKISGNGRSRNGHKPLLWSGLRGKVICIILYGLKLKHGIADDVGCWNERIRGGGHCAAFGQ